MVVGLRSFLLYGREDARSLLEPRGRNRVAAPLAFPAETML